MIKGTITTPDDTLKFSLPEKWEEVTLGQFLDIEKDPENIFPYLSGIPKETVDKIKHEEVAFILSQLDDHLKIDDLPKEETLQEVTIDKVEYKAVNDFGNMGYGHFEDMKKYSAGLETGDLSNLHILLSIMLQKENYNGVEAYKMAKIFKEIPITDALMLKNFFLTVWLKYMETQLTKASLKKRKTSKLLTSIRQGWETFKTSGGRLLRLLGLQKKRASLKESTGKEKK